MTLVETTPETSNTDSGPLRQDLTGTGTANASKGEPGCTRTSGLAPVERPGIRPETLAELGIRNVDADEAFRLTGTRHEGVYIPYPGVEDGGAPYGRIRLKHPQGDKKYHQRAGTKPHTYHPPGLRLVEKDMFLVEGEFKAISLMEAGYPAIGLSGFYSWRIRQADGTRLLEEQFEAALARLEPARIVFIGDSDTATNYQFADAALSLTELSKRPLALLRIPYDARYGKGVDDIRGELGPEKFQAWFTGRLKEAIPISNATRRGALVQTLLEHEEPVMGKLEESTRLKTLERLLVVAASLRDPKASEWISAFANRVFSIDPNHFKQRRDAIRKRMALPAESDDNHDSGNSCDLVQTSNRLVMPERSAPKQAGLSGPAQTPNGESPRTSPAKKASVCAEQADAAPPASPEPMPKGTPQPSEPERSEKNPRHSAGIVIAPPAKWLAEIAARSETFNEKHLRVLGRGAWTAVFFVLLRTPKEVENARFCVENWDDEVYPGVSRLEWLIALGEELDRTPFKERLNSYLEYKYGKVFFEIHSGRGVGFALNELRFAASFLIESYVEFDNNTKVFRRYESATGVWQAISDEWCRKLLMDYAIPYVREKPALYSARHAFFKDVFENCRPLGLTEKHDAVGAYMLMGVKNGAIALKTDPELVQGRAVDTKVHHAKHCPAHNLRNAIPVEYNPLHQYPAKFITFLKEMMEQDEIEMLQHWCGMVLLGKNFFHRILIISGDGGSGKSTLLNILETMIGSDNIATLNTERLEERFELSEFYEKTLLVGRDVGSDFLSRRSAHMLKSLSGDCGIKAELKNVQQRVRLGGPFNIVMVTNANLRLNLQGDAVAWDRRLLLIRVIRKRKLDVIKPDLDRTLIGDEGPAILNWMLQGARKILVLRRLGKHFPRPQRVAAAVAELLGRSNPVADFVAEDLEKGDATDRVSSECLYSGYLNFCARKGYEPLPESYFHKRVGRPIFENHHGEHSIVTGQDGRSPRRGYVRVKMRENVGDRTPDGPVVAETSVQSET